MARILVIDDEPIVLNLFRHVLESEGHSVEVAAGGAEGLDSLSRSGADVVIVDLIMPNVNGVATIRRVRRRYPNVLCIPMTGLLGSICAADKLADIFGSTCALIKPIKPEEILSAVRDALAAA